MADAQDIARYMDRVARELLGAPNEHLSKQDKELRYGSHGSLSIDLAKGTFFDFETNEGGGVLDLIEREKALTGKDAFDFMRRIGCDVERSERASLSANGGAKPTRKQVATFDYHDAGGKLAFQVLRFVPKHFKQRRPDGNGGWDYHGGAPLPYRLPELLEATAHDRTIFIVEGEAKVDALAKWNVPATCNAGGAKKWKPKHSAFLKDADVVLVPDNDDAGWQHVNIVAASLVGIAKRIRVLVLPGLQPKGDVIDWGNAGGTREQLDALVNAAQDWKPPSEPNEDEKAKAKAREDELLDALAKVKGLDYDRQRKAAAKELDVSAKAIDDEIKARREDAQVAPLYGHWTVEPWPEPVEGGSLLRDIIKRIQRHVIISSDGVLAASLWLMMSWVHDEIATHSPILNINSAEPESGKSTLMGLTAFLMPKCIASVEASEAAIYRAIERWQPSFCFDEFDSVLADEDKAALRSVINSGHTREVGVMRCTGDDNVPTVFPTFAPKVIGMVGRKLPPATLSRCIFIEMRRRKKSEHIEKFNHRDDSELADLRRRLRRWSMDSEDALRNATPSMPDELKNRRSDNWQLQLAIADLAREEWGDKARAAAIRIESGSDSRTANARVLAATKTAFESIEADAIGSEGLVQKITADPNSEWAEWKAGKPITQMQLARLLKQYGIAPEQVRIDGRQVRGYLRAHFVEAWERWL